MGWRLVLTAIELWWGYNAIQMFSCEYVSWSGRSAYCTSSSGYPSGAETGGGILVVVVLVLGWLWVWPFIRAYSARLPPLDPPTGESLDSPSRQYHAPDHDGKTLSADGWFCTHCRNMNEDLELTRCSSCDGRRPGY
jgi:hypothetical protein